VLTAWRKQARRYGIAVEGYVIMPDHIHLLVRGTGESIRKFMQYSLAEISRYIQQMLEVAARHGDLNAQRQLAIIRSEANGTATGKLWKERFRAFPLDRMSDVGVKLEYMHNNPVKRGLVNQQGDWRWSSYCFYYKVGSKLSIDLEMAVAGAGIVTQPQTAGTYDV
jgi:REP element-mobilizing transposase RayT